MSFLQDIYLSASFYDFYIYSAILFYLLGFFLSLLLFSRIIQNRVLIVVLAVIIIFTTMMAIYFSVRGR